MKFASCDLTSNLLTSVAESERVATLIHVPSDVQMLSDAVTDAVLSFVQQSQVAVGVCAEEDYVAQVSALWTCLAAFPRGAVEADLVAHDRSLSHRDWLFRGRRS